MDLEVLRAEGAALLKNESHVPYVIQLGITSVDMANLFSSTPPQCPYFRQFITSQFSTEDASEDFEDCDATDFQECVFARTERIGQSDILPTIERYLQYPDVSHVTCGTKVDATQLRPVLLVGRSIQYDLNTLRRVGLGISSYPIIGVLDTHSLSCHVLPSGPYILAAVLGQLGCPFEAIELHNAGNDATYTLVAALLLAVTWADRQ